MLRKRAKIIPIGISYSHPNIFHSTFCASGPLSNWKCSKISIVISIATHLFVIKIKTDLPGIYNNNSLLYERNRQRVSKFIDWLSHRRLADWLTDRAPSYLHIIYRTDDDNRVRQHTQWACGVWRNERASLTAWYLVPASVSFREYPI